MTDREVLRDIEMRLSRIESTLAGIGMSIWGPTGNPFTEDALKSAREVAEKFKERREQDLQRALEARRASGMVDPEQWSEDDEFASQMS